MSESKECFLICPIGAEGSDARKRSDKLKEHIIEDAVTEFGYTITRADEMSEPGSITNQVIEKTVESELVIADLTGHNPNVFYELAVRHSTAKPYIQLIDSDENIPFDISDIRTINYDFDVESATRASEEIKSQLETIQEEDPEFDTPISRAAELKSWRESEDPTQQNLAEILGSITQLNKKIDRIDDRIKEERKLWVPNERRNTLSVRPESESDYNLKFPEDSVLSDISEGGLQSRRDETQSSSDDDSD